MLLCPVRNCALPLTRRDAQLVCANNHNFDIARTGYVNLLQPQDRRSKNPGDTPAAVAARRRLHDRGITLPLLDAIAGFAALDRNSAVLDAGCGDGFYLGSLQDRSGCAAHGIDISRRAIDLASRRYPACEWIVANADRFIPYANESFSLILSITGRMNSPEFHRVLRPGGSLLVAIPAPDDLLELRGHGRDRIERTLQTFAPHFTLIERRRATTQSDLDAEAVQDLLTAIYRPLRPHPPQPTRVTLALDLLRFQSLPDGGL